MTMPRPWVLQSFISLICHTEYVEIPHKPLVGSIFNSTGPSTYFTTSRPTPRSKKKLSQNISKQFYPGCRETPPPR
ncbi:hypothetical protein GQ44DRAFT_90900 [Phaeosphaeriaceae sp. PMI808]|nr:hypothetical protein GQ44DRAFT_90900 [Phaeosphaeriaceae sp. PMI808]